MLRWREEPGAAAAGGEEDDGEVAELKLTIPFACGLEGESLEYIVVAMLLRRQGSSTPRPFFALTALITRSVSSLILSLLQRVGSYPISKIDAVGLVEPTEAANPALEVLSPLIA